MPDPIVTAASIYAGANILNGITGFFGNDRTNQANMELAQYQNAWNLEQWHRENEYNSPQATMSRLVAAGINPQWAASNGSSYANAAQSPQAASYDYQSPLKSLQIDSPSLEKMIQVLKDLELKQSEIDKNKAQADLTNEERETLLQRRQWDSLSSIYEAHKKGIKLDYFRMDSDIGYQLPDETFGSGRDLIMTQLKNDELLRRMRELEVLHKEDQQKFRETTGFSSPKEALPFVIKLLELIFK